MVEQSRASFAFGLNHLDIQGILGCCDLRSNPNCDGFESPLWLRQLVLSLCLDPFSRRRYTVKWLHHMTVIMPALGHRHLRRYNRRSYKRQTVIRPKSIRCGIISVGGVLSVGRVQSVAYLASSESKKGRKVFKEFFWSYICHVFITVVNGFRDTSRVGAIAVLCIVVFQVRKWASLAGTFCG